MFKKALLTALSLVILQTTFVSYAMTMEQLVERSKILFCKFGEPNKLQAVIKGAQKYNAERQPSCVTQKLYEKHTSDGFSVKKRIIGLANASMNVDDFVIYKFKISRPDKTCLVKQLSSNNDKSFEVQLCKDFALFCIIQAALHHDCDKIIFKTIIVSVTHSSPTFNPKTYIGGYTKFISSLVEGYDSDNPFINLKPSVTEKKSSSEEESKASHAFPPTLSMAQYNRNRDAHG